MICPSCNHENRQGAKFCEECSAPLKRVCAGCGSELRPGAKFCDECGAKADPAPAVQTAPPPRETPKHLADKIRQSKAAVEGERKQVTVLFADVKGSMELAESLDPEAFSRIMSRFFAILTEGVERFEGFVDKFTGDGIMALFGAPIAHEDHAQRACYAALHLRDEVARYADELRVSQGVSFSVRMGLNSGEVVVGTIGEDMRMDYTAQGHTVGLAQRMENLAPADGVALSAHTQKAVDGFFALRGLGPVKVKGAKEPIEVFVLEGVGRHRTRMDTSRARGLSRFVGRAAEMTALETALSHSVNGTGRVAAVVGEPGVGKSRICNEFIGQARAKGLAVYEAHCPAHGKTVPYLPLLELLRNLFGISDQDGPREARQKIAGELALLDDGFAEDRSLVLDFLGVGDPKAVPLQLEPAVMQRRLFTFLRRLIQLRTQAEPIVILIDDLHWIDPGSDLFVAQIVEAVSATRTLLLVNFRPEYQAEWLRKSWVLQLPMTPLDAAALSELVRDWVGNGPSVAKLPALIGARSGGNPFFSEEIVLSLLETGRLVGTRGAYELVGSLDTLEVPATVQAVLAARIDRLGEREKLVLYAASVIGKEFSRPLLEAVSETKGGELDAALASLLSAEIIHERSIYPVAEYAFKHPLTHEVSLHAQLTAPRRQRHKAAAQAIEAADPARLDELSALLAHHWGEAGDAMRAADWHIRAARWVRSTDIAASRWNWAQAHKLLVALPKSAERSRLLLDVYPELLNLLDRLGADPREAEAIFREGIELARGTNDRRTEALLEAIYSQLKSSQNDFESMVEHAKRAIELADAEGDRAVGLLARYCMGRGYAWQSRWDESITVFDQSIAIAGGDEAARIQVLGWTPYVESLGVRSACLSITGRVRQALEFSQHFPRLVAASGAGADLSSAAADRYWACWISGDADRARLYSREALQMAERCGSDRNIVYALFASGNASTLALRWEEGSALLERATQRIAATGTGGEWSLFIDAFQALCLAGLGERDRSLALARRHFHEASTDTARAVGVVTVRAMRMAAGAQYLDEIESHVANTLQVLFRRNAQGWLAMLLLERAALAKLRGNLDGMKRDLVEARRMFAEMGVIGWDDYASSIET